MSAFRDMVAADNLSVFLNCSEFADKRTIIYDGCTYTDVHVVLSGIKEKDRHQLSSDHAQGLFSAQTVLHCLSSEIGGKQFEKGTRLKINEREGGGGFFREFYVASSTCEMGMVRAELEAISE